MVVGGIVVTCATAVGSNSMSCPAVSIQRISRYYYKHCQVRLTLQSRSSPCIYIVRVYMQQTRFQKGNGERERRRNSIVFHLAITLPPFQGSSSSSDDLATQGEEIYRGTAAAAAARIVRDPEIKQSNTHTYTLFA